MDDIALAIDPPLARIRLNRPERRNAVSLAMWRALPELCWRIEAAKEALVVIVEGAGDHFSVGADINEFDAVYRNAETTRDYLHAIQDGLNALIALDKPTLAALRGNAIGGGLALGLCCDLRFCADNVHVAITASKLGLLFGFAETRRLVDLVGPARAKDILYSARRIDGAEALAIGLIDRLIPAQRLTETVEAYARDLAGLSQQSIRGAKSAVEAITRGLATETQAFRRLIEDAARGEDSLEGRRAFAEKRAPNFKFRGRVENPD
ncbi:MAG TPA: enoyl-CoA hydratase-related protein [Roseiarcus sp.]|nr:enoyl-CoA hydratase-related protein [Roseiarcus sp.]